MDFLRILFIFVHLFPLQYDMLITKCQEDQENAPDHGFARMKKCFVNSNLLNST